VAAVFLYQNRNQLCQPASLRINHSIRNQIREYSELESKIPGLQLQDSRCYQAQCDTRSHHRVCIQQRMISFRCQFSVDQANLGFKLVLVNLGNSWALVCWGDTRQFGKNKTTTRNVRESAVIVTPCLVRQNRRMICEQWEVLHCSILHNLLTRSIICSPCLFVVSYAKIGLYICVLQYYYTRHMFGVLK